MNIRKNALLVSIVLVLALLFVSCGSSGVNKLGDEVDKSDSQSENHDDLTIGAIVLDTKHEWFAEVIKGMEKAGEDLGVDVKIASSDSDASKEADLIDNFIAQGVDAISISPQNDQASVPAVERAILEGIPVVTWNSKVDTDKSEYFVGVDNYSLGAQTGEYAVDYIKEHMNGEAKIAILAISKYSIGMERVKGFMDKVEELPGVEIVAQQDAEFKEDGMDMTETILQAHPDTDIVWAWNQGSLLGALAALKGENKEDVLLMGTDMSIDLAKTMLEEGSFLAAVTTQQPYELGYTSIKNAVELAKDGETESQTLIPLATYTLEDKDEVQKYLDDREYLID